MLESEDLHRHRQQTNREVSMDCIPEHIPDPSGDQKQSQFQEDADHPTLIKKKKSSESVAMAGGHKHFHFLPPRSCTTQGESFLITGFMDILRESITLLRANSSQLMAIMALLICPVSALLLSRPFLHNQLALSLSSRLHGVAYAAGILKCPLNRSLYSNLAQIFLSYAFYSPAFFTLVLLAKAAVVFTVACTYEGKKPSFPMFFSVAPKLWKRLFFTHLWSSLVLLGLCSLTILLLLLVTSILDTLALAPSLVFIADMGMGVCFSVIFAQTIIIGNVANVVTILEEQFGLSALVRSLHLIKGRTQVAFFMYFANTVGTVMVASLFQYRVIGTPSSEYPVNIASRLWEGPLLVFMYSFLFLLDYIMTCVFYCSCKSGALTLSGKQTSTEQISIVVDSTDQG